MSFFTRILLPSLTFIAGFIIAWKIKPEHDSALIDGTPSVATYMPSRVDARFTESLRSIGIEPNTLTSGGLVENQLVGMHPAHTAEPVSSESVLSDAQKLKQLLANKQYQAAVEFYSSHEHPQLKKILLSTLASYSGHEDHFSALSDAFLDYYYADTDVLLLRAQHQFSLGLIEEALLSYDFAYHDTSNVSSRSKIHTAYFKFVEQIDKQYAHAHDSAGVLDFYRRLRLLSINTNHQVFREVELNILVGNTDLVRELLQGLINDTLFESKARKILASLDTASGTEVASQLWDSEIPLVQHGRHFLIETTLNRSDSVSLLVDTGASVTSISQSAFESMRSYTDFSFVSLQRFNTAGGVIEGKIYAAHDLSIGGYHFSDMQIAVIPMPTSEHYQGLLGMNVLSHFHFQLDQERALLKVLQRN